MSNLLSQNNYFYHSFPRPRYNDGPENTIDRGLRILECLSKIGIVLAPEIIEWNQPLSDGNFRKHHTIQQRICFTEISSTELQEHGKKFGPFAIEWEISNLRRLGALPVFYIPQTLTDNPGLSAIGISLVVQLSDCQHTIDNLLLLKQASELNINSVTLKNTNENGEAVHQYSVPTAILKNIVSFLSYRNAPFDMMRNTLDGVSRLFYPADNLSHDKLLDYYRQREWRLVGTEKVGQSVVRKAENNDAELIQQTNPDFWNCEIFGGPYQFKRIDQTLIYSTFEGHHVLNTVRRVIVPYAALERAKEILSNIGLNIRVEPHLYDQIPSRD